MGAASCKVCRLSQAHQLYIYDKLVAGAAPRSIARRVPASRKDIVRHLRACLTKQQEENHGEEERRVEDDSQVAEGS